MLRELRKSWGGVKAYFTDNVDQIDGSITFPMSQITKEYFLIVPETRICDEKFFQRLFTYGVCNGDDCLALRHSPFRVSDGHRDLYNNIVHMESEVNIYISGFNNSVQIGRNVKFPTGLSIKIGSNSSLLIGNNVTFSPRAFSLSEGTDFIVGDDTTIQGMDIFLNSLSSVVMGKGCSMTTGKLRTGRNQKIIMGDDIMASWNIVILAHDGHLIWDLKTEKPQNNTVGEQRLSIEIGDHCWLGGECVIAGNTRLGNGSIVGYRSLVKGKFPNNCIVAGTPARLVKRDIAWSRANVSEDEVGDFLKIPREYREKTVDII